MSLPRQILPGTFYLLTRSCAQRMFLLKPDVLTRAVFAYCLAEAARRYGIVILLPVANINHHHTVLYDPNGNVSLFMAHFHKMVAKTLNAHWGHEENFWSTDPPGLTELVDYEDVIDALVYVATNPVKDGLVSRAHEWPGYTGVTAFLSGKSETFHRPKFFREDGPMPETVTLELAIPPRLGDAATIRAEVRRRIAEYEDSCAAQRRAAGTRVLGKAGLARQKCHFAPTSRRPRSRIRPRFKARDLDSRKATIERHHAFQGAYRRAYRAWRAGEPAIFPTGTYWLARFANVTVAPAKNI